MKNTLQRIMAVIGLVLIFVSILLMLAGLFAAPAKALLLNISLFCFLGAVTVLMILSYRRKKLESQEEEKRN